VNDKPPRERDVAMVFQNYALYPHMNVRDNLSFALKQRKMDKGEIDRRVGEAARILGIERFLDRKPRALSGGQMQRVALGRAIVREPKAFLMDEPLSNLDAKLRVQMRTEIAKLHNRIGTTTIYVTHDQTEAMTMADRIVVLKDGFVQQIDTPQRMYNHPKNVFVAGFIGSPAMNFIRARLEREDGGYSVVFGDTHVPLSREDSGVNENTLRPHIGDEVVLGVRPEHMEDATLAGGDAKAPNTLEVEPQVIESMGSEQYLYFGISQEQIAHLKNVAEMTEVGEESGSPKARYSMRRPVSSVASRKSSVTDSSLGWVVPNVTSASLTSPGGEASGAGRSACRSSISVRSQAMGSGLRTRKASVGPLTLSTRVTSTSGGFWVAASPSTSEARSS
jgi:multiple sugar transport system ATP-binding protein